MELEEGQDEEERAVNSTTSRVSMVRGVTTKNSLPAPGPIPRYANIFLPSLPPSKCLIVVKHTQRNLPF